MINISMIPPEFVYKYILKNKAHNGYIFAHVTKGIYGIPQAGLIAHGALVQHLEPYGYRPSNKTQVLWTRDIHSINLIFVVGDFGVKYLGKERTLHLKSALEDKYKVITYWEVKLYIGIVLKWDYKKIHNPAINTSICIDITPFISAHKNKMTTIFAIPLYPNYLWKEYPYAL